jgi:DDE superfamily endonuclease
MLREPTPLGRQAAGPLPRLLHRPTFVTFCGLALGFWAQAGLHTVTGMLCGARLQQAWHHARAHRFFSSARWSADQLGLVLLELILALLVSAGAPVRLVADDTLMRPAGRKVFGTGWHHDPLAPGRHRIAWANNWVVLGVLVDLPFVAHRSVCLPILARLWQPKRTAGRLDLAVELVKLVCDHLGTRRVDLLVDGAYAGKALRELPRQVTVTTRLRADACLHRLPAARRPSTRGRPPGKGERLPDLTRLAGMVTTPFALAQVTRYGLDGFDLALVTTDLAATPVELVERYATRWSVEVCFREARQDAGVGQARNRTRLAVQRTVPFGLICYSLAVVWYATCGHHPADLAARRAHAPWYQTKAAPSAADMLAKLHRVLIAAQCRQGHAPEPTLPEILQVQAAWAASGA